MAAPIKADVHRFPKWLGLEQDFEVLVDRARVHPFCVRIFKKTSRMPEDRVFVGCGLSVAEAAKNARAARLEAQQ